jgi:hypothetical protein
LPSGNILATDRQQGLFVLSSDYSRGCYFNATVIDSISRQNIIIADIEVLTTDMIGTTNIFGNFRSGQAQAGSFQVVVSKAGYLTDTFAISLTKGQMLNKQFALLPLGISTAEQDLLNSISIYPNPAHSVVRVDGFLGFGRTLKWSLTDLTGRLVQQGELLDSDNNEINFGEGLKGYYLLRLNSDLAAKTFSLSIK